MKLILSLIILIIALLVSYFSSFSQNDTTIDGQFYKIIKRFENGKARSIGQYGEDCAGNKNRRHGLFISYSEDGKEIKKKWYFYDHRRNKKFLGMKVGWWGMYLTNTKYFFGRKVKMVIVDPCF